MDEEPAATGDYGGPSLETFTYSAGSYDRLRTNEEELFELVKLSEVPIDKHLFKVILELLKLNVAPAAILQVLKSLRPQHTPDDLVSRSPVPQRSIDSYPSQHAPPISAESSYSSAVSSFKGSRTHGKEDTDGSDRSEWSREGKEVESKTRKPSSERHRSKHREKSSSSGSRHHHHHRHHHRDPTTGGRDPTGGSAKLKVNELMPKD